MTLSPESPYHNPGGSVLSTGCALDQAPNEHRLELANSGDLPLQAGPSNALLVVAKRPAPGRTKTRLSPPLSPEQAATLYECFLKDTLQLMRRVPGVRPVIAYLPQDAAAYFAGLAPDFDLLLQQGPDLGSRLDNALTHYLELGYSRVVVMDSDGPTLPPRFLELAFERLGTADVVLGPCDDGGYYLIGLKKPAPRLLREVRMSTPRVAADTLALAQELGLRVALLPAWYDVDDAHSLGRLLSELEQGPPGLAPHTRLLVGAWEPLQGQFSDLPWPSAK
jgi:rSAM/selenodomain-associated transferase 1